VLLSGHHGNVARWRRDQALRRTAERRPDLVAELDPAALDARDREVLDEAGFPVPPPSVAD
jgi:tRNA (guanine37-N1)-methyltransferase